MKNLCLKISDVWQLLVNHFLIGINSFFDACFHFIIKFVADLLLDRGKRQNIASLVFFCAGKLEFFQFVVARGKSLLIVQQFISNLELVC